MLPKKRSLQETDDPSGNDGLNALPTDVLARVLFFAASDGAADFARFSTVCHALRDVCHSSHVWTVPNVRSFLRNRDTFLEMVDPHGLLSAEALTASVKACNWNVSELAKELQGRDCIDCSTPTRHFLVGLGARICLDCWKEEYHYERDTDYSGFDGISRECSGCSTPKRHFLAGLGTCMCLHCWKKDNRYQHGTDEYYFGPDGMVPITNDRFFENGNAIKLEKQNRNREGLMEAIINAEEGDTIFLDGAVITLGGQIHIGIGTGDKALQIAGCSEAELGDSANLPVRGGLCSTEDGGVIFALGHLRLKNLRLCSDIAAEFFDPYCGVYMGVGAVLDIENCIIDSVPCHGFAIACDVGEWPEDGYKPLTSLRIENTQVESGMFITYSETPARTRARIAKCSGNIFRAWDFMDFAGTMKLEAPLEASPGKFADDVHESNRFIGQHAAQGITFSFVESSKGI